MLAFRSKMTAAMPLSLTPEEYLAWERAQPEKHAYYQGEVFAMAGASRAHNRLVFNIIAVLGPALRGRPCQGYPSDMRVRVTTTGLYTYPDVTVVCGKPELEDDTLLNPQVVFEVVSPSTEGYDRGEKFWQYQSIPSFREYVLVSQHKVHVDHFVKRPDGWWLLRSLGPGETIDLSSVGCSLPLDEVYLEVLAPPG
jgi:Uma2 family endonuclease